MTMTPSNDSSSESKQAAGERFVVQVARDGTVIAKVNIDKTPLTIGRSKSAELRIDDDRVSRRHAEIARDKIGRWVLRDLGSRNGTLIDGLPVSEMTIDLGRAFTIGDYTFRIMPVETASERPQRARPTTIVDSPLTHYSTFGANAARIDTHHLHTLTDFGHELLGLATRRERLERLCRLMVDGAFHGRFAAALSMRRSDLEPEPQALCDAVQSARAQQRGEAPPHLSRGLLAAINDKPAPTFASNTGGSSGGVEMSMAPEAVGEQAAAAVPLNFDDDTLEVLYVAFPPQFGTAEWLTLVALAAQQYQQAEAAIRAQEQAQRHAALERELAAARVIQFRLVPREPSAHGLEIALGFEPCRWVGGDYVDVVRDQSGATLLVIADVTGKGLPAALVASEMHAMVHAFVRAGAGLGAMMDGLNSHLCEYLDDGTFVTAIALRLDSASGELECINAGHPPALVIDARGEVRSMQQAENLPLGIAAEPMITSRESLPAGALLAMYTDGLTEMRRENASMLNVEGLGGELAKIYAKMARENLTKVSEALSDRLDAIQGARAAEDDRTYLLARRAPGAGGD
ncbi:MAG: SpoIIE family protein phosphatase [Planctomycetes bacterium]|nr:SpoIIE family protein phosphatase [Planctomycetota bacterium]